MWAFGGSSSNVNVAAGINNYMPTNIGGSITSGSVGNASIFQDGTSSATGGTNSLGIKVQGMPGLMELVVDMKKANEWRYYSSLGDCDVFFGKDIKSKKICNEEALKIYKEYKNGDLQELPMVLNRGGVIRAIPREAFFDKMV